MLSPWPIKRRARQPGCRRNAAPWPTASDASNAAYTTAADAWEETEATTLPVAGELDTAKTQYADAKKKADEAAKAAADAAAQLAAKQTVVDARPTSGHRGSRGRESIASRQGVGRRGPKNRHSRTATDGRGRRARQSGGGKNGRRRAVDRRLEQDQATRRGGSAESYAAHDQVEGGGERQCSPPA